MASLEAVKRHNYDQHRVRRAMTGEWERRVRELKHERDTWKERAEKAEQNLENHDPRDSPGDTPGLVP